MRERDRSLEEVKEIDWFETNLSKIDQHYEIPKINAIKNHTSN